MTYRQLLRLLNKSDKSEYNGDIIKRLLSRYGDKRTERLIRNYVNKDRKKLQSFSKYHGLHDKDEIITNKQILFRAAYQPSMRDAINGYKKDLRDIFSTHSFSYKIYQNIDKRNIYEAYQIAISPYCDVWYIYEEYEPGERDDALVHHMELVITEYRDNRSLT